MVNQRQRQQEPKVVRRSAARGLLCGNDEWVRKMAKRLRLESTLRLRGRPTKYQLFPLPANSDEES